MPVTINGVIYQPGRRPLAGACVYGEGGSVQTDAYGAYSLTLWRPTSANTVSVYVAKPSMTWNSVMITAPVMPSYRVDLGLSYPHTTTVAPSAMRPGQGTVLAVAVLTTAPPNESRLLATMPGGTSLELARDLTYGIQNGNTKWVGSWGVPTTQPEGLYRVTACVLANTATGTCASPGGVVLSKTEAVGPAYTVDGTPPALSLASPRADRNTIEAQPQITVNATDARTSVKMSTARLTLDGLPVAVGTLSYQPPTPLTDGIHEIEATVEDAVGNVATRSWRFDVVPTILFPGRFQSPVPATAGFGPGTSQVTLDGLDLHLESGSVLMMSSMTAGVGTVDISLPTSSLTVEFSNGIITSEGDPPRVETPRFQERFAVLQPLDGWLKALIPERTVTTGLIDVDVPAAFQLSGGTVKVFTKHWTSAQMSWPTTDPLPAKADCPTSTSCTVTGDVECRVWASFTSTCDGTYTHAYLHTPAYTVLVANPAFPADIPSSTSGPPNPSVVGANATCNTAQGWACVNLVNPDPNNEEAHHTPTFAPGGWGYPYPSDDSPPIFSAYGHFYYDRVSRGDEAFIVVWQQTDGGTASTECAVGDSRMLKGSLRRLSQSVEVTEGTWDIAQRSLTGQDVNPNSSTETVVLSHPDGSDDVYRIGREMDLSEVFDALGAPPSMRGRFLEERGTVPKADGSHRPSAVAATNTWLPFLDDPLAPNAHVEIGTGTEFSGGSLSNLSVMASISFEFVYDNGSCL